MLILIIDVRSKQQGRFVVIVIRDVHSPSVWVIIGSSGNTRMICIYCNADSIAFECDVVECVVDSNKYDFYG